MSEPRRPPPPKSYVPLNLSNGPPKLPPRPTAADAGPPPNYTPPPPPLSDEEDGEMEKEEVRASSSKPRPAPPTPYQPKSQPAPVTRVQTPPTPQAGLRPPPNRPTWPPIADTPSPESQPSAPPRTRRRAATISSPRGSPKPPSNPIKRGRPEITVVSAHVMEGDVIPVPTKRPPPAPSRPQPPTSPASSASPVSQSPRVPVRKAPTRPPPLKKAPHSTPPQPAKTRENHDREKEEPADGPPAPVAPPRKAHDERKKPPLHKSHTLPPQPSPPQPSPTSQRPPDTHHNSVPPKPSPYKANRPPPPKPYRPSEKTSPVRSDSVEEKDGRESPPGVPSGGSGIRIISSRRAKPQAKERVKPVLKESGELKENELAAQLLVTEGSTSGTKETTETIEGTKSGTKKATETQNADQILQPQPKERTKSNAKQTNVDQTLQPQTTQETKVLTEPDTQELAAKTEVKSTQDRPPLKPRRVIKTEGSASPEGSPQPRPRVASASRPKFHKPSPPLADTKELPHPSPAIPGVDLPSTSLTENTAKKPSRPPSSPSGPPPVTAEPPKAKRRNQLVQDTVLGAVEDKSSISAPNSSVTQPPIPSPRKTEQAASEENKESSLTTEVVKQPQKKPEKPPLPRQLTQPWRGTQTAPPHTTTQKQPSAVPKKPPPPRQVPVKGTSKEADETSDAQPDSSTEVTAPQRKATQPDQIPPPSTTQPGGQSTTASGEGVVNPPVAKRRNTSEKKTLQVVGGEGNGGHITLPSGGQDARASEEEAVNPPVVKRRNTTERRSFQEMGDGGQPSTSEKEVGGSRKVTPPAVKRPSKKRTPMVIRPAHDQMPSESKPSESDITAPKPASVGQQVEKQLLSEECIVTENDTLNETEASVKEPQKSIHDGTQNSGKEKSEMDGTVQLPAIAEQPVPETKSEASTANVMETTQGVVLRGARAADTGDIRQRSRPKPARPMSMPPGRPGKPPKPAAPPARPPGQTKPPKPTQGPTRPAHGPTRPAQGPSRPPPSKTPRAHSPHPQPVDPRVPPSLPPRPSAGHLLYKYVCEEPHGLAMNSHEPSDPAELAYDMGDVIELIERIDQHWFFGRNADLGMTEGIIPARDLRIVKGLQGENKVRGFEEGPCAVAMHTFNGESSDELTFKEGDLIMLKSWVGKEWLRGKLINGQEGIFPKTYVEIVEELPADAVEEVPSTVEIRGAHCVAVYQFAAASADELSLSVGDTVELLERVGAEWLKGRLRGKEGIFPSQFVEIKEDLPVEVVKSEDGLSKTLYDFDGQEGELSFKAGALVKVVCRVNEEWVEGQMAGKTGMFPASFVDHLPSNLPKKAVATEPPQVKVTGKCEALFDFNAENSGELSFKTGDTIETLEWVNEEWITGRLGNQEGMFPIAFVKILKELPKPAANKEANKGLSHVTKLDDSLLPRAEALQDFSATDNQRLSFKTGDILNLLEKIDSDWYSGENTRTGNFGDFPASSVKIIVPLP